MTVAESDLPLWVVYDHPIDYPDDYVARQHIVGIAGQRPTGRLMKGTLESLRTALSNSGLVCISRSPEDEPQIVETWL